MVLLYGVRHVEGAESALECQTEDDYLIMENLS
jgi:hypothetical protein